MSPTDVGYFAAFMAGLVSFVSPCVLPLVPVYLSVVSGVGLADIDRGAQRRAVVVSALGFVLGFSVVFVGLGATASALGAAFAAYRVVWARAAGVLAIVMGLTLMGVIKWKFLLRERRLHPRLRKLGPLAAPLLGAGFAFGWTPCIGPVLASILAFAAVKGTVGQGVTLLALYAAGLGVPFLATALAYGRLTGTVAFFRRNAVVIDGIAGGVLTVMGILLVTDQMKYLTGFLVKVLPLARLG